MRTKIILSAIVAAAMLVSTPLELLGQGRGGGRGWSGGNRGGGNWNRGGTGVYVGPGGISVGSGRSGFSIGTGGYGYGRSYGYGRYGSPGWGSGYGYGYPRGWGYGNYGGSYYSDGYYTQPGMSYSPTFQVQQAYDGPGVAIRNKTDVELNFTVDDSRQMSIEPGETVRLAENARFTISFDRGSDFGSARYTVHEGLYEFTPTENGWELYRQKSDNSVAAEPNPDTTPRTAERPRFEELPAPDREFDDRPEDDSRFEDRPIDDDRRSEDIEPMNDELPSVDPY